jgi:hypothetical protein
MIFEMGTLRCFENFREPYTANNYSHCTAFCGVTFPTVILEYSVPLMAVMGQ